MEFSLQVDKAMKKLTEAATKDLSKRIGYAVGSMYDQIVDFTPIDTGNLRRTGRS